ncbi:MAG: hypothetical protein Q9159_007217 [Coniocarpon cinnabarinum]
MSKPTADWDRVGDRFYRKIQLYSDIFDPDVELENYLVAGAPFSGALALHRDTSKIYSYRAGDLSKSTIDIYSSAGRLIKQLNWDKGPISGLGWSEDEVLVVVSQDATVRCYKDLSDDFVPFTLGIEAEENGVGSCRFWSTGFIALLGNNQLVSVTSYDDPRPKVLATPPSDDVVSWTVIPPALTLSRSVEVLLGIGQTINVVDANDSEDRMLQNGPFRHMSVSPNGRFVALYTDDGKVWVVSGDFQEKLSEYDTKARTVPKDMQWCGSDAVVLAWEDEVHLVGPSGASSKYYYDVWVHLIADVDGIRIFTNDVCEFLQRVPDVSEDTFNIGSTAPPAVLLDAIEQFEQRSPKADDNIQLLRPSLVEAVDACIAAAGHEFNTHWQKQLLKAASFGKNVLEGYDSDEFVSMSESIRVLNAVRSHEVGLPLSYDQYFRLGSERLLRRLISRDDYVLALKISEYLRLPRDRLYIHWASKKARQAPGDEEVICRQIVDKLDGQNAMAFDDIARSAYNEGRVQLATKLLNHERRAGKQVQLLLDMEEDTVALDKAIESGDTDLILFVLLQMRKKMPLASFFRTINTRPTAVALVEATARDQDQDLLKDLYYQDDRRLDGASLLLTHALGEETVQERGSKMRSAAKLLGDAKEHAAQAKWIEEAEKLMRLQEAMDRDPKQAGLEREDAARERLPSFVGMSLNQTVYTLIEHGSYKRAQQLASDFKMAERTQWWVRLRALVAARSFRELETIGTKTRKSPIGWEPFATEILNAGNARLAGNVFVPKCTNLSARERMDLYVKCGLMEKAGEEALKARDREWLEEMRAKTEGRDLASVERFLTQLGKGR